MDAKREILARIVASRVPERTADRTTEPPSAHSHDEVVRRFVEYAAEYRANVVRVSRADLRSTLERVVEPRIVVPEGLPLDWLPPGVEAVVDDGFDARTLDEFPCVVTACAVAIAETGTLVLDSGAGQGRRALSLIPDHHVCVVREDQIVASVPEAVDRLRDAAREGRPMTWISGPSATSDIELSRVEGVHGPRRLDIVVVDA